MVCVQCGEKTQVVNSRLQQRANQVWRRRKCLSCRAVFTTEEIVQYDAIWIVRSQAGHLKPFSRDKLLLSLYSSLQHRQNALSAAYELTETMINKLMSGVKNSSLDSSQIAQTALVALNRFDKVAAVHYQAFHGS